MFSLSKIQSAIDLIAQSDGLVIAAGAGMGVDSGLPDFRGNEGFWKAYPALGAQKMPFHEIASPAAFRRRPAEAWGFYGHRLNLYRRTIPHVGFDILLKWATAKPMGYSIFTSNVDGQFQRAGFDPQHIHECHGSIHHMQCMLPCRQSIWSAEAFHPEINTDTCQLSNRLPVCPHCGGLARPNILMFDDWDWLDLHQQQQWAQQQAWLETVRRPLVIEIGAGTAIPTVRHFSQRIVQRHGGRLIRINVRESEVASEKDIGFAAGAVDTLTAIDQGQRGH